ncbi:hypothetical protein DFH09DRAFT_1329963 [Mycena vulgaris]|nr:hypothetical protein DFH09DRAFT_1329963 [Mycena vulgaris]
MQPRSRAGFKQGAEIVNISLVVENAEVFKAFSGVNMAFLVTNFWEHVDMEKHGKAAIAEYGRQSGIPFVDVQAGFYHTPCVKPTTVVPLIDTEEDYGLYVRQVFELPVFPEGSEVFTSGENITVQDLALQLSQATEKIFRSSRYLRRNLRRPYRRLGLRPMLS